MRSRWISRYKISNVIAVVDARLEGTLRRRQVPGVAGSKCRLYDFKQVRHYGDRGSSGGITSRIWKAVAYGTRLQQQTDQKILCEGSEPLTDQDFAAIHSCPVIISQTKEAGLCEGTAAFGRCHFSGYASGRRYGLRQR